MAKKKLPTMEDVIKQFKDVTERASLSSYYHVNKILLSKNENENKILIVPDNELWEKIVEDPEINIQELDMNDSEGTELSQWFSYGEDLEDSWVPIDIDAALFSGKIFKIKMKEFEYQIPINRDLMPLKLKKSEYEGISYKVFSKPLLVLAIKKRFDSLEGIDGGGFSLIRLFQVI